MLTSFFGKSNPINFFILGTIVFLAFLFGYVLHGETEISFKQLPQSLVIIGSFIFLILLLDFILRKNNLTQLNAYSILIFTLFVAMLPAVFSDVNIVLANVFIWLAFRRILSIPSERNLEKKILDASLWISIAMLFYFWSVLFFAVLYWVIIRRTDTNFRYLVIPVTGVFVVGILSVCYVLITQGDLSWFHAFVPTLSIDFSSYNSISILLPTAVVFTFLLWTGFFRIFKMADLSKKERPNARLVLFSLAISLLLTFMAPEKTGAEMLFVLLPLSIVTANYIERIKELLFKESLLWLLVLLPIILLFV